MSKAAAAVLLFAAHDAQWFWPHPGFEDAWVMRVGSCADALIEQRVYSNELDIKEVELPHQKKGV